MFVAHSVTEVRGSFKLHGSFNSSNFKRSVYTMKQYLITHGQELVIEEESLYK